MHNEQTSMSLKEISKDLCCPMLRHGPSQTGTSHPYKGKPIIKDDKISKNVEKMLWERHEKKRQKTKINILPLKAGVEETLLSLVNSDPIKNGFTANGHKHSNDKSRQLKTLQQI